MKWLSDVLKVNAKIYNLLKDVEQLNKRIEKIDDDVRDMGRDLATLKGYLAGKLDPRADSDEVMRNIDGIASKVTAISEKLSIANDDNAK